MITVPDRILAAKLRRVLKDQGIQTVDAARLAGVSPLTFEKWVLGVKPVPWSVYRMFELMLEKQQDAHRIKISWSEPDAA